MEYNFGEKEFENINGNECKVWQTPKYLEAKKKVIETLESEKYRGILQPSDFWILMNTYANKTKVMYSGLIISHNGCLKINDILENKVNPKCFSVEKDGYKDSLVFTYIDDDVYENGEVNSNNCKNDYPYAMAYKRCFDRVVLKKCKLAYSGVYSDSEAEEFKEKPQEETINYRQQLINYCAENELNMVEISKDYNLTKQSKDKDFKMVLDILKDKSEIKEVNV